MCMYAGVHACVQGVAMRIYVHMYVCVYIRIFLDGEGGREERDGVNV